MRPNERPRMEIVPTTLEQALDWISLAGVVLVVTVVAAAWTKLPERVPTHFGLSGAPDDWGSRNSVWLFVGLALVTHFALTALAKVPWIYNYPTAVTEENYPRLYALGRAMMLWIRTEVVWLMALLGWQIVRTATGEAQGLGSVLGLAPAIVILATTFYFMVLMLLAKRPPQP